MCDSWQDNEAQHITGRFAIVGFFGVAALIAIGLSMVSCDNHRERTEQIKYACSHSPSITLEEICTDAMGNAVLCKQSP